MIKVTIYKEHNDSVSENDFNKIDPGKDIVCSAVSILVINTVNSLDAFTESTCEIETDDDMGYINCYIKNPTADSELLMKSLVLGLEGIKDSYGEYVEIYYKEV